MKSKQAIIGIVVLIIVALGVWWIVLNNKNVETEEPKDETPAGLFKTFTIERPNFIITSEHLAEVEIVGVPSGTNIAEESYVVLGKPILVPERVGTQTWKFPIPSKPILLTEIFVRGTDTSGQKVEKLSLPYIGVSALYALLWVAPPEEEFNLSVGETHTTKTGKKIKLTNILEDSRCPKDVVCIQAGRVVAELALTDSTGEHSITLSSTGEEYNFGNLFISITDVKPDSLSKTTITKSDYIVNFSIVGDTKQ